MAVNNRQTLEYVYNTLKPIIDKSAQVLHNRVDAGIRAQQERPVLYRQISDLQFCIMNNRYDRETVRDAENDLADYEDQAHGVAIKIARGQSAEKQLGCVRRFYDRYNTVVIAPQIAELQVQYDAISDCMDKLSDRIFACSENMNPLERDAELIEQSANDMQIYRREYLELSDKLSVIGQKISNLKQK